jgi:hypothetical protein
MTTDQELVDLLVVHHFKTETSHLELILSEDKVMDKLESIFNDLCSLISND